MENKELMFAKGYKSALEDLDEHITNKIRANGGATTAIQVLNVFNATLSFLHQELVNVNKHIEETSELNEEDLPEGVVALDDDMIEFIESLGIKVIDLSKGGVK